MSREVQEEVTDRGQGAATNWLPVVRVVFGWEAHV